MLKFVGDAFSMVSTMLVETKTLAPHHRLRDCRFNSLKVSGFFDRRLFSSSTICRKMQINPLIALAKIGRLDWTDA
jgi:hypothetical protein